MNDIVKLRELVENGYQVKDIKVDSSGKGVIELAFTGTGNPLEGKRFFLITDDELVINRAREMLKQW